MSGFPFIAHGDIVVQPAGVTEGYTGSPMYDVISQHGPAIGAVVLFAAAVWLLARGAGRGRRWAVALGGGAMIEGYRKLAVVHRFLAWLLAIAGVVHIGLVFGHEPSGLTLLYALDGAVLVLIARRLLLGRRWRRLAGWWLTASIVGYAATSLGGEPPDQVGMATKLVELTALVIVLTPRKPGRFRRLAAAGFPIAMAMVVALGAWAGAFGAGDGSHHHGEVAQPGVLLPLGEDRPPTPEEIDAAEELYAATVATARRYADPEVARADGYLVDGMFGTDFHAENPAYKSDGRVFDPERPENLLYAVTDAGPVITGVMYETEGIRQAGPEIGGPLTVWHAHDHVCFSLTPPALAGLTDPFGMCPVGSITMPITNEMIHVWTLPGVPEKFGHLDDAWLEDYLAAVANP